MSHELPEELEQGTIRSYTVGFVLSIVLTVLAYFLVMQASLSKLSIRCAIGALAIVQAAVQLILFLNLNSKIKPRWNLISFLFTIMVVLILILGSIWIIDNLNYNMEMK